MSILRDYGGVAMWGGCTLYWGLWGYLEAPDPAGVTLLSVAFGL